jgi:hypothetical protein
MMAIKDILQAYRNRQQLMNGAKLQKEIQILKGANIQMAKDILSLSEQSRKYISNKYKNYESAVLEIENKYNATADWGVIQTGNIIDIRAAFIMSEGIKLTVPQGQPEESDAMKFAIDFLDYNDLMEEVGQEFAKEAEIEGKILLKLFWDEKAKMVSARYISWLSTKYTIETNPQDYLDYIRAKWTPLDTQKEEVLEAPVFVYKKFGGRINKPNTAAPKVMKCLSQIDDLDQALRDLREINRLFAAPIFTQIFKGDKAKAKAAAADIDESNWKIKKALTTTADEVKYVQPSMQGVDALVSEITNLAKMISGTTGVPVHFLGLPDLLSNRATADNLMDLAYASTLKERKIWTGAYLELLAKAMAFYNEKKGIAQKSSALKPEAVGLEIPFVSAQNWAAIEKVFLPLSLAGKISDELILSKIPGVDVKQELKRQTETKEKELIEPKPPKSPIDNEAAEERL